MPSEPQESSSTDAPSTMKSWSLRSASMPWIPGSPDQIIPRLQVLLRQIEKSPAIDDRFEWPDDGGETTVRATVRALGRSALFTRNAPGTLELTSEAQQWLMTGSNFYLMKVFHENVRFFGELLDVIRIGGATHEALRKVAVEDYGLPWDTHDQVRRRTNWLRAAGFVELWSTNDLVIKDDGQAFLDDIELADPKLVTASWHDDSVPHDVTIGQPGARIAAELDRLDQDTLRSRKRAISYIPGGDPIDVIQQLVALAESPITREKFEQVCSREFEIAASSASGSLSSLRAANLLEQVGPSTFHISPVAREWLESDDPLDLVRIFHFSFIGVGELLPLLDETTGAGELSRRLEATYGISRLPTDEIARRLRILESAGLIHRVTQMSCRVSPLGLAFYETIPALQPMQEAPAPTAPASPDEGSLASTDSSVDALTRELIAASTDTANTARLETAVASALNHLGFSATHVGGSGRTDVLVEAWISPGSTRTIAVDAKTAGNGVVKDTVEFNVLREHRKTHKAALSAIVGPGFDARLSTWAVEDDVALISTAELVSVMCRQAVHPIPISDLAQIFSVGGIVELRDKWTAVHRQHAIVAEVVARLWRSANSTGHVKASGGALSARDLWLMMMDDEDAASQEEIEEVLRFLASPLVNAVESRKNDVFVATLPPSSVAAKLAAIRAAIRGHVPNLAQDPIDSPTEKTPLPNVSTAQEQAVRPDPSTSIEAAEIRRWAATQGMQVAHRGRLPGHLIERYRRERLNGGDD